MGVKTKYEKIYTIIKRTYVRRKSILKKPRKHFKKQWKVWHASHYNKRRNLATGIVILAMYYFYFI